MTDDNQSQKAVQQTFRSAQCPQEQPKKPRSSNNPIVASMQRSEIEELRWEARLAIQQHVFLG
jgi:hypothetical protein